MILVIGEILFDRFPEYQRLGGAPFNFAFHLIQLGMPVTFISRIGADQAGAEMKQMLGRLKFPTEGLQVDAEHHTGLVLVKISEDGSPEYDILADAAFDHISYRNILTLLDQNRPDLIYFGSVIQRSDHGFRNLHEFLSRLDPQRKCLFDINLRSDCLNENAIFASLERTDLLKLNDDELHYLKEALNIKGDDARVAQRLLEIYSLELIALTKGDAGSIIFYPQNQMASKPPKDRKVADSVGAGDAFAAMLAVGYIKKWTPDKTIDTATEFASRICEIEGAVPMSRDFYDDFNKLIEES